MMPPEPRPVHIPATTPEPAPAPTLPRRRRAGRVDPAAVAVDSVRLIDIVGQRIAHARLARGMNIEDLAQRAAISHGLLSQIERGIGNPSLRTLTALAGALGLPIGAFFDGASPENDIVVRRGARKRLVLSDQSLAYELLVPDLQGNLSMLRIELPPGFCNCDKPFSHAGEECELVLEGRVEAHIGEQAFELGPGDSIRFNCALPHWFRTFDERVVIVSAMTPPSF